MGRTSLQAGGLSLYLSQVACATGWRRNPPFTALPASFKDELLLADGFSAQILVKYNEPINSKEFFGTNNDYLAYIPLSPKEGLLWVNHESLHLTSFHNRVISNTRTKADVLKEQLAVGGSILHIEQLESGEWRLRPHSIYNRRITARTWIPFQRGYSIQGQKRALGTLGNCAGGVTPWGDILTCEENYDKFYGDIAFEDKKRRFVEGDDFQWYKHFPLPPEHYGWVVQVNPKTGKAQKLVSLGRFEHEGAKVQKSQSGKLVVYMGQDRPGGFIFKFVSDRTNSLETGTLYVANTDKGEWMALDLKQQSALQKYFDHQHQVLTYASMAAKILGATPHDRPEDIEIDPISGDVFVALTNNLRNKNPHGGLLRLKEENGNYESLRFDSKVWLSGGPSSGLSCPDNMAFDAKGNLWVTGDMDLEEMGRGTYQHFGNNSLYYVPLLGAHAGQAFRVASAPRDAEFTGPYFSEDYKTLFLSVQHPGEGTRDPKHYTSHWPEGGDSVPKSAVITVQGPTLEKLTGA